MPNLTLKWSHCYAFVTFARIYKRQHNETWDFWRKHNIYILLNEMCFFWCVRCALDTKLTVKVSRLWDKFSLTTLNVCQMVQSGTCSSDINVRFICSLNPTPSILCDILHLSQVISSYFYMSHLILFKWPNFFTNFS